MVNLTQKIKNLALQNNIPYQDCTAKLTEYFVFNNWFNDTPKVINKELYISDETWNNNENEIVSYFSSFNKTPEQKHERLVQMFEKEFPETFEYFNRFKRDVTVDRSSVVSVLDFLLYYLPGEIAFSSSNEIKYLLKDASEHLKRCDAEVLVFFINWLSESRSIRTAFSGLYQVNNYSKAKNNEAYDLNFYLNVLYHMLNADYISKNQMYLKAAKSKDYIDTWLFISLHFLCALRTTDLLRFPHPKLAYSPEEVLEKVKKGEFTDEDAKRTLLSINVYLNAVQLTPNKTKDYSGISTIHFHVPSSLEVHVGTLFAIAEAHFQLSGADKSQPLLRVIREYRDIKKAMGDEIANLFIKSNFHCRQANKSFLQMIEYLTRDIIASNNDFTADEILSTSIRNAKWICPICGGEYSASVEDMVNGLAECPYCNNQRPLAGFNTLKVLYPEIAEEMSLNNEKGPDDVLPNSSYIAEWICSKCGYTYKASVRDRVASGDLCPACAGKKAQAGFNSLLDIYPEVQDEWAENENTLLGIFPDEILPTSTVRVWWECKDCGRKYLLSVNMWVEKHIRGMTSCTYCSGLRMRETHILL